MFKTKLLIYINLDKNSKVMKKIVIKNKRNKLTIVFNGIIPDDHIFLFTLSHMSLTSIHLNKNSYKR